MMVESVVNGESSVSLKRGDRLPSVRQHTVRRVLSNNNNHNGATIISKTKMKTEVVFTFEH